MGLLKRVSTSPDRAHAAQWAERPWNGPAGRLIYWLNKYNAAPGHTVRAMVSWAYQSAIMQIGEQATRQAVAEAGLTLPEWVNR